MTKPVKQIEQPFLPRYQVTRFIGEGAAAHIYQVTDLKDGSIRAIKALKPQANAEPSIVERFEEEYRILRRLHHPSLPEVYDYGFTQDRIRYIVMELVEGVQLDQYFQSNPQDLWLLLYELCEVLSFIHDRDLLHLDLKPANILVKRTSAYGDEKPMVVLMDFGLSYRRNVGGERSLVGTPEYMAPEIIKGDGRLTRAADYYSLGISLYQLLAGETPFHGTINDVFQGHLRQEIQFKKERTQFAELYPHVLGLVSKDINPRLKAFEEFRRAVTGRIARGYDDLDRAYGLSVISSIGMFGKRDLWEQIADWIGRPDGVLTLVGPSGSGKTYLLDEVVTQMKLAGKSVFRLTSDPADDDSVSTFQGSVFSPALPGTSPESTLSVSQIEIFMEFWEQMTGTANPQGILLLVDNFELLEHRQIEFLRYVSQRLRISQRPEKQKSFRIVIAGNIHDLGHEVQSIFGHQKCLPLVLSPLTTSDIDNLTSQLPGTPLTGHELPNLIEFLKEYNYSTAATLSALESVIVDEFLQFSGETIRFRRPEQMDSDHPVASLASYYVSIVDKLTKNEQDILEWMTCHEGPIAIGDLAKFASLSERNVLDVVDALDPHRLLSYSRHAQTVSLANPRIQNELYATIPKCRKEKIHNAFVKYYSCLLTSLDPKASNKYYSSVRQLLYQYHELRQYRPLFRTHLHVLYYLRATNATLPAIAVCELALRQLDEISNPKHRLSFTLIRRYFVKQLVNYYWIQNEIRSIRHLVRREYAATRYNVPTCIALKSCLSFVLAARYDIPPKIAESMATRYPRPRSPGHLVGSLVMATSLVATSEYPRALRLLKHIEHHQSLLDDYSRCRLHTSICIAYDHLNDKIQLIRYLDILKSTIDANKFPHEYLTYLTARFNRYFDDYHLTESMRLTMHAIRFATKHRSYNRLVEWYFRASAVYYERGSYARSIRYVKKVLQLVERLGLTEKVPDMEVRLAMNYQCWGQFGNAARHSERAMALLDDKSGTIVGTVVHLFDLDINLTLNSPDIDAIWKRTADYFRSSKVARRQGYYWYLAGTYHYRKNDLAQALTAFQEARRFEETSGAVDDAVRSGIREATVLIELFDRKAAKSRISNLRNTIRNVESKDVGAEFSALLLAYHYFFKSPNNVILHHLANCEAALLEAMEIPVILNIERLVFRAKAGLGDTSGAIQVFDRHLRRVKRIVSNITDHTLASSFLGTNDFELLSREYKILRAKVEY